MINIDDRLIDQLTEAQMWLLIHVVKRINADGECWPSIETMRKDTKWSDVKKVRKVRDELVNIGILEAYERKRDDGGQASNLYRINTEYIGVYVTAKRLQNLTGGEGKNLTQGVGKEITGGEGKNHTPPNEVLTNEVLINEQNSLSTQIASDEKSKWMDTGEERVSEALHAIAEYLKANPSRWSEIKDEARVKMERAEFWDNVKAWIRWNADNWPVIQHPVKALTSGRSNFVGWLMGERKRALVKAATSQQEPKLNPDRFVTAKRQP